METGGINVKALPPVLSAASLIDVCLSKTQRKTPTEVHRKSNITVIKKFYMRKIKACAQFFVEKMKLIIVTFPKLDAIHPFYSDLLNILYDRDHYKLALGQIATSINRIERVCKEYLTLSKYSDSLYKSKSLKIAAFGRYCTIVKKLAKVFGYIEQVRMHMQRLPSIQTSARTLLLAGFPNVGKSSFVNLISNANVDVQPFAFTTKSLFIGHFDYMYSRWQVIDTPGILDHSLEERNLIEMLAITALTHLHCVVLFIIDVSEECGQSITAQISLFRSIQVLFKGRPKLIILNKTDKVEPETLPQDSQDMLKSVTEDLDVTIFSTSTLTGAGVDAAKNAACDLLLQQRLLQKASAAAVSNPAAVNAAAAAAGDDGLGAVTAAVEVGLAGRAAAKLHICSVHNPRQPFIPDSVVAMRELKEKGIPLPIVKLERDLEEENGGPGVYSVDLKKKYILDDDDWKYDVVPEMIAGRNVRDFYDLDIERNLEEIEKEESALLEAEELKRDEVSGKLERLRLVRAKLARLHRGISHKRIEGMLKRKRNGPRLLKKTKLQMEMARQLLRESNPDANVGKRVFSANLDRSMEKDKTDKPDDCSAHDRLTKKVRSMRLSRSTINDKIQDPLNGSEIEPVAVSGMKKRLGGVKEKAAMKSKRAVDRKLFGRSGESDRYVRVKMIKHLMSGKRGIGKTQRR